jgi:hypothetical protein
MQASPHLLMDTHSIAIWNSNKLVKAIATTVWVTNLGFLIHRECLHTLLLLTIWKLPFKYVMVSDVVQVNINQIKAIMDFPDLSPSPDPHCMDACSGRLHGRQRPQCETQYDHHVHRRHHLTTLNARWLTPSGLPRIWCVWFGASHVETGQGVRASH